VNNLASHGRPAAPDLPSDDILEQIRRRAERLDHGLFGIGIEILPYELIGVITDVKGFKLATARVGLVSMEIDPVVAGIARLAHHLSTAALDFDLTNPRLCMGVELGGPVDSETGVVRFYANNPHDHGKEKPPWRWDEVDLADRIQNATGCITVLENDAHAHAVYEQKLGVGQRSASFALLLIRHGIGAGIVINNELLPIPAEIGHLTVWPEGRECDCGKGAHVESRAGRRAIPAVVAEKTGLAPASFERAVGLANGNHAKADLALEAFAEAGNSIAQGMASILTIFGSSHVVIYGPESLVIEGSGRAAETFMKVVRTFPDYTFEHLAACEITSKPLELDCGAVGAALTALHRHFSVPLEPSLEPVR
jgi:predicted NBD/HSP70 family sugar kinase